MTDSDSTLSPMSDCHLINPLPASVGIISVLHALLPLLSATLFSVIKAAKPATSTNSKGAIYFLKCTLWKTDNFFWQKKTLLILYPKYSIVFILLQVTSFFNSHDLK